MALQAEYDGVNINDTTYDYAVDTEYGTALPGVETPFDSTMLESARRLGLIIKYIAVIYYLLLIVVGMVGNGLIIFTFHTRARLRADSCNLFLVHMSQVNLIVVCLMDPVILYYLLSSELTTPLFCKVWSVVIQACAGVTAFFIIAIAVNRYFLIARSRLSQRCCTRKSIKLIMGVLWVFVLCLSVFVVCHMSVTRIGFTQRCAMDNSTWSGNLYNNLILFSFFLPLLLIVPVAQAFTLRAIRASRQRVVNWQSGIVQSNLARQPLEVPGPTNVILTRFKGRNPEVRGNNCVPSSSDAVAVKVVSANISFSFNNLPAWRSGRHRTSSLTITETPEGSGESERTRDSRVPLTQPFPTEASGRDTTFINQRVYLQHNRCNRRRRRELPLIRMMICLYILLCLSWLPFWIKSALNPRHVMTLVLHSLAWLNPVYYSFSPFIYALSNRHFRVAYRNVFRKVRSALDNRV